MTHKTKWLEFILATRGIQFEVLPLETSEKDIVLRKKAMLKEKQWVS